MLLQGTWGDLHTLQAAATLYQVKVHLWTPWDHTFPVVCQGANAERSLYLAYNGMHYDAFVSKRRLSNKGVPYLLPKKLRLAHSAPLPTRQSPSSGSKPASEADLQSASASGFVLVGLEAHAAWHNLPDDTSFKEWSQDQLTKGHVVVTTYNVTSFITHEAFLTSLPGSLLAAQEVGCRMEAALRLKARLSKQGYSVQLGPAPQSKVYSNRSSDTAAIGGLLVAATQGGLTPLAQDLPDALQVPRVQACRWLLQGVVVYVFHVWGFAGGSQTDLSNNVALLTKLWEAIASLGNVPVLFMGDYNLNILETSLFRIASHSGWVVANLHGRVAALPTVKVTIGDPHVVDWILVNPIAAPALQGCITWRGQCATHAAVSAAFSWSVLTEKLYSLSYLRRPKLPSAAPTYVSPVDWESPISSVQQWHSRAEIELKHIVQSSGSQWCKSMEGRGFRKLTLQAPSAASLSSARSSVAQADGALPLEARRAAKQVRRLEKLLFLVTVNSPCEAEVFRQLTAILLHDKRFDIVAPTLPPPALDAAVRVSKPLLQQWLQDYQDIFTSLRSGIQQSRLLAWRKSLVTSEVSLSSKAFSWLSGPPKVWDGVVHTPSGPVYSTQASFDMLTSFWKQFWCKHQGHENWEPALSMVASLELPSLHLPPLSGSDLRSALRRSKPTSAAGADGWSHAELSLLPLGAWQAYADVWNSLERSQQWQHDLLTWSVALPKPGTAGTSAADFRLINILPRMTRLALSARARTVLRLLLPHLPKWLVGSVPGRAASDLWLTLSLRIGSSHLQNTPIAGLTLDLLKAFNALPRQVGHALLTTLGFFEFSRSYHSLLNRFDRTVKLGNAVHPHTFQSTTGYPEGDPFAPICMLLFAWAWGSAVSPIARPLAYLDNWEVVFQLDSRLSQAWVQLEPQIHDTLRVTQEFCNVCDLTISVKAHKTWLWSTNADIRARLRSSSFSLQGSQIPISQQERDLGAHLVYSKVRGSATSTERFEEAGLTAHRLQAMPLPYSLKVTACRIQGFR